MGWAVPAPGTLGMRRGLASLRGRAPPRPNSSWRSAMTRAPRGSARRVSVARRPPAARPASRPVCFPQDPGPPLRVSADPPSRLPELTTGSGKELAALERQGALTAQLSTSTWGGHGCGRRPRRQSARLATVVAMVIGTESAKSTSRRLTTTSGAPRVWSRRKANSMSEEAIT